MNLRDDFYSLAKLCMLGDVKAELQMSEKFRARLSENYLEQEAWHLKNKTFDEQHAWLKDYMSLHPDESDAFLISNTRLQRAAIYGSERAQKILEEVRIYRFGYIPDFFQLPGNFGRIKISGEEMRKAGFIEFPGDEVCYLQALNAEGIYIASYYTGYDHTDDSGFGMEEYDNYFFFDEFFCYLFTLENYSTFDFRAAEERILNRCVQARDEKQAEREEFWRDKKNSRHFERYRELARTQSADKNFLL